MTMRKKAPLPAMLLLLLAVLSFLFLVHGL
jgi:hypothetical protein